MWHGRGDERPATGAVYTPDLLAAWVAEELVRELPAGGRPSVLDPACGEGALLEAVALAARRPVALAGIDVDAEAVARARAVLPEADLTVGDALAARDRIAAARPDAIVANPPWGARLAQRPERLRELGYSLAAGQFDSFEPFVELAMGVVAPGGVMAFILPDAIFQPEHEPLRRLLLERTTLLLVARLGEGFFPGVYRGTAVVIARAEAPAPEARVRCVRLTPRTRRDVLAGRSSLAACAGAAVHEVPQARFATDARARLDVDLRAGEAEIIAGLERERLDWRAWVSPGRGVELGKRGEVVACPRCARCHPSPRRARVVCAGCGLPFTPRPGIAETIVRPLGAAVSAPVGWAPLIVGEDVHRHTCAPSRQIKLDVPGLRYKDRADFARRKLLVRKTGVGLKAAVDESGALTTQVVFHFLPLSGAPDFALDYLAGVLCSRVLLAYHLRRSGDAEWRSHPYVTPRVLMELPVPGVTPGTPGWTQARAIAEAAAERRRSGGPAGAEADVRIDRLVAELYGLDEGGRAWALRVLDEAQALEGIAPLRLARM